MSVSSTSSRVSARGGQAVAHQRLGHLAGQVEVGDVGRRQVHRHRHRARPATSGRRPSATARARRPRAGAAGPPARRPAAARPGREGRGCGCCQRTSASAPTTRPSARPICGWRWTSSWSSPRAPSAAPPSSAAGRRCRRAGRARRRGRRARLALAAYMATSAQRSSSSTVAAGTGALATPMLTPTCSRMPSTVIGWRTSSRSRWAQRLRLVEAGIGQQDGELVAAQPGQQVAGPQGRRAAAGRSGGAGGRRRGGRGCR